MDVTYIKLFVDYLDAIEPLGDAERGRLFTALLQYAGTGEAPQLSGNERFIFPMMRAQIDRDISAMDEKSEKRSECGKLGGRPKKQTEAKKAKAFSESKKSKDKEEDKDKEKDNTVPPYPPKGEEEPLSAFSAQLQQAVRDWFAYKAERQQTYKPTGRKNLISQIKNSVNKYGDTAVEAVIRQSMSNNYQGILWDRLEASTLAKDNLRDQEANL